ncbi:metallophosphoesterase [Pelagibacterium limicola]|uniref:metallophosphoesterase n=1 Tax=Pelagibacterium limicola TaxID=2791022 RepID=UPI0018AFA28F|nr:metallophosphoesterase [Pelagibacterium limicola]
MMRFLAGRLSNGGAARPLGQGRPRLATPEFPAVIYAVGDVHGRLDLLKRLEEKIATDAVTISGQALIVMLGDYIDRGPSSAQTLAHLISPMADGLRRICLCGNHEQAMFEALDDAESFSWWLRFGGSETLASYGISEDAVRARWEVVQNVLADYIPIEHISFLAGLPVMLRVPGYVFAHAGLRPGVAIEDQTDHDLCWIRDLFLESGFDFGATVVHGHTIAPSVHVSKRRIGLDLGAFASGRLAAVRLMQGRSPKIMEIQL